MINAAAIIDKFVYLIISYCQIQIVQRGDVIKKNIPFLLTQKDCNKDLIQKVREERHKVITELLKRKPTDLDFYFAEEFPNTVLAGKIAASETNHIVNVPYTRSHSNTLYGIKTALHKNADTEIFKKTVDWFTKKENANSQEAGIIASRLKKELITEEVKKAVRGELKNTAFGKGIASNKNFWDELPSLDNPKTRDDVIYMMHNPNDLFSEGIASVVKVTDELKTAGVRVELAEANETLGKRIREGEIQKIPYLLIVGEKEKRTATVAVRKRGKGDMGAIKLSTFIKSLNAEIIKRK